MKLLQRPAPIVAVLYTCLAGPFACGNDDEKKPAVPAVRPSKDLPFAYVDVAQSMGYTLRNRTGKDRQKDIILEAMPPGIAVGDFNGDGWMDLYCPNGNRVVRYDRKRKVFIDGKQSGFTNRKLRVEEGAHLVHLGEPEDLFAEDVPNQFLTTTGTDGRFSIGGVTPDSTRLVVFASGCSIRTVNLRLPEDLLLSAPLPIQLSQCPILEVQLFAGADELHELRLIAFYREGTLMGVESTDPKGRLLLSTPAAGRSLRIPASPESPALASPGVEADPGSLIAGLLAWGSSDGNSSSPRG